MYSVRNERDMLLSGHQTAKQTDCSLWQQVQAVTGANCQWDASLECMNNDQGGSDALIAPGLQGIAGLTPQEAALVEAGVQVANTPGQHAQAAADSPQQGAAGQLTKSATLVGEQVAQQQLGPLTNGDCPKKVACGLQNSPNTTIQQGDTEVAAATASNGHVPSCADHAAHTESDEEGPSKPKRPAGTQQCPRCSSQNTKFCYYNNYNIKQPRYYCRDCQRYWTMGGTLRQIAPGAGRRKTKAAVPTKGRTSDHDGEAAAASMTPSEAEAALYSPSAAAAAAMAGTVQQAQMMSPAQTGAGVFSAPLGFLPSAALTAQPQALGTAAAAAEAQAPAVHQATFCPPSQGNMLAGSILAGAGGASAAGSMGNLLAGLGPAGLATVLSQQPQQLFSQGPDVLLQQVKQLLNPPALNPLGGCNPLLAASMLPGTGGMFPAAAAANLAILMGTPEALQTAAVAAVAAAASGMDPLSSLGAIMSAIAAAGQQQQQGQQQQIGAAMAALATAGLMPKGLDLTAAAAAAVQGGPAAAAAAALGLFKPQQQQQQQLAALSGLQSMFPGLPGLPNFAQQQQQQEAEQQMQQLQMQQLLQVMQGALQAGATQQQLADQPGALPQQLPGQLAIAAGAADYQNGYPAACFGAATAVAAGGPADGAGPADAVTAHQPATAVGSAQRTSAAGSNAGTGGLQPTGLQQKRPSDGIHSSTLDGVAQHATGIAGADTTNTGDRRVRQRVEVPAAMPGQQQLQQQQHQLLPPGGQVVQAGAACQLMDMAPRDFSVANGAAGDGTLTALMCEAAKEEQQQQHSQQHQGTMVQGTMGPPPPHKPSPQHKPQHLQQQQQQQWPDLAHQLQQQLLMQQVQSAVGGPAAAVQQQLQQLQQQQQAQLQVHQAQQQLQQQAWLRQSSQATAAGTTQFGGTVNPELLRVISQLMPQGVSQGLAPALGGTGAAAAGDGRNDPAQVGNMLQQQHQLPPAGPPAYTGLAAAGQLVAAVQAQAAAMQLAQVQPSPSVAAPQQASQAMGPAAMQIPAIPGWDTAGPAAAAGPVGLAQYSAGPWLAGKQSWDQQLQISPPQGNIQQQLGSTLQQHIQGQAAEAVTGAVAATAGNDWMPQVSTAETTAAAAASYMAQQMAAAAAAYPDLM